MSDILALDTRLFLLVNEQWTSGFLDVVMPFLTDFDHWRIPVIVGLLIALARGSTETRVGVLFAILAVVATDQICSSGIKPIVDRSRPFGVMEGTRQLVEAYSSSFPSSHAANTFAAGTFLALRFRWWWLALVVPIAVSYSRVYVGVHWPLDVVAGAAIGASVGGGFAGIERASRVRLEDLFSRWRLPPR